MLRKVCKKIPDRKSSSEGRLFVAFKKLFFISRYVRKDMMEVWQSKECLQSFRQLFFQKKRNV